ncbi:MAG: NAD(+)/NADH kinase, partial [Azoarcus sp.]|nr:NAD(+)/NADH kinase [Azoarcus sp.]
MTSPPSSGRNCRFPPQTIALIGKDQSPEIVESLSLLAKNLHDRGVEVLVDEATAIFADLGLWTPCTYTGIGERADAAIVLGGDGTMLNAVRHLARHRVPLVGVNQGRLGFMTDIARA